jgi:Ca-activated chloride channel family protein
MPDPAALADLHFLRPWWLAGIAAVALLHFALGHRADAQRQWRGVVAAHLLAHLVVNRGRGRWLAPRHLLALTLLLAFLALAGPAWQREPPPFVEDRAPLVIAVDLSPSMNAIDVAPTRLARAKQKVRDLLALRAGARTALIAYAGDAHVVLPFTDDPKILSSYVEALASELMPVAGRKPSAALNAAEALLARETNPGSILFVTDGVP